MRRINRWTGIAGLGMILVSSSGCGLAIIPGLVGVGAGGYLWGKEAARETTASVPESDTPTDVAQPTPAK